MRGVVLDTSVLLNVLGSDEEIAVLTALSVNCMIVTTTSREVLHHPLRTTKGDRPLDALLDLGVLHKIDLPASAHHRFLELVGPVGNLDDGEAAALAAGEALGLAVAIDERKGRRVASQLLPSLELLSSSGIFRSEAVVRALGPRLADALFSSLLHARMRVQPEDEAWVHDVLGLERAAQCRSLPRRR